MSSEIVQYIEPKPQPVDESESTADNVYFIEKQPRSVEVEEPLIEERQEIQRRMAWVALIQSVAGPEFNALVEGMMENNRKRIEQGVEVDVTDNFRYSPVFNEGDILKVRAFIANAPGGVVPPKPHLHIVSE